MPSQKRLPKKKPSPRSAVQTEPAETPMSAQVKLFGRRLSVSSATSSVEDERRTPDGSYANRQAVMDIMNACLVAEETLKPSRSDGPLPRSADPFLPVPAIDISGDLVSIRDSSGTSSCGVLTPTAATNHSPTSNPAESVVVTTPPSVSLDLPGHQPEDAHTPGNEQHSARHSARRIRPPWRWFEGSPSTEPGSPSGSSNHNSIYDRPRQPTSNMQSDSIHADESSNSDRATTAPKKVTGSKGIMRRLKLPDKITTELNSDSDDDQMTYGIMAAYSNKVDDARP